MLSHEREAQLLQQLETEAADYDQLMSADYFMVRFLGAIMAVVGADERAQIATNPTERGKLYQTVRSLLQRAQHDLQPGTIVDQVVEEDATSPRFLDDVFARWQQNAST